MTTNAKIAIAVVGGYVLGRTKKAKLALGLGMFLAGKKLPLNPEALRKALMESPVLAELNGQVREQIVDATKAGAKGALTKRVGSLADTLHQRTLGLNGTQNDDEDEPVEDEAGAAPEGEGGGDDAEQAPRSKRSTARNTTRRAASTASKTAKTATKSRAPAGKASGGGAKPASGKTPAASRKTSAGTGSRSTSSRRTRSGGDGNG